MYGSYLWGTPPRLLERNFDFFIVESFSFRLKAFYVVNFPSFGEKVMAIAKKIIKPKVFERVSE